MTAPVVTTPSVRRWGTATLAGMAALLVAWILLIPPFGGTDEFDHAYRAAATARGQWVTTPSDATRGTGAWLQVPGDIVEAARPECRARSYTTAADCVGTVHGATVRIASGAGRYNPAFYALVGTAALPFGGNTALYVMRLVTAALCVALVGLAIASLRTWARSRTANLAPIVACTPVMLYSCAIVSPNGVEIAAALTFWCAAVGLVTADARHLRRLTVHAAIAGVVLCTLRPLGPLWCLAAGIVVLVSVRPAPDRWRALLTRGSAVAAAGVVALSALASTVWTLRMHTLEVGADPSAHPTSLAHRMGEVAHFVPLWVLQSIAAFPMRDNATSPAVYACYLLLLAVLMVTAYRVGDARLRIGLALVALGGLAFAYVTTVSSYDSFGPAWQGRYGLPFTMGLAVLGAYALDRAGIGLPGPWPVIAGLLFVVAQVVSVAYTTRYELRHSPLADSSSWHHPPTWALALLAFVGAALLWWGEDLRDQRRQSAGGSRA